MLKKKLESSVVASVSIRFRRSRALAFKVDAFTTELHFTEASTVTGWPPVTVRTQISVSSEACTLQASTKPARRWQA